MGIDFKTIRENAGLTQCEAAELMDASPRTIQDWEAKKRNNKWALELFLIKTGQHPGYTKK